MLVTSFSFCCIVFKALFPVDWSKLEVYKDNKINVAEYMGKE